MHFYNCFLHCSLQRTIILFFCSPVLISMATAGFQGIGEAGGLQGVKADGWLSHE